MATLTYPSTRLFVPSRMSIWCEPNVMTSVAPLTKSTRRYRLTGAPWRMILTYPPCRSRTDEDDQATREAFFNYLGGQENLVALWHFKRPAPLGTMRGSPTLSATAVKGATSLSITTTAAATLKAGDMLQLGSTGPLVQVREGAAADGAGALSVNIVPKLRAQVASGTAVVWDKPKANFLCLSAGVPIPYAPAIGEGFTVEFIESYTT
jgi:predicted RecA/RadA family phage recombinase